MKKIGKSFMFLLFTFGISYCLAGLFYALGEDYSTTDGVLMAIVYMFIPALSVLLVEKFIYHRFIWGIRHAPMILMGHTYAQHPVSAVFLKTIWCILLNPLFLYIPIKSKSVIEAFIMLGNLNATDALALIMVKGENDLLTGLSGLAGFIAAGIAVVVLFVYEKFISHEKIMLSLVGNLLSAIPEHKYNK